MEPRSACRCEPGRRMRSVCLGRIRTCVADSPAMASAGALQPSGRLNSAMRSTPLGLSALAHASMARRNTGEASSRSAAISGHWLPLPAEA